MQELIRSNDPVLLSLAEAILREEGIYVLIADQAMSILEGSIGAIPRRLLVAADDLDEAHALLVAAGLGQELRPIYDR